MVVPLVDQTLLTFTTGCSIRAVRIELAAARQLKRNLLLMQRARLVYELTAVCEKIAFCQAGLRLSL